MSGAIFCFTFTVERQVNARLYVHNKSDYKKIFNNKERCQHKVLNLGRLIFAQIAHLFACIHTMTPSHRVNTSKKKKIVI